MLELKIQEFIFITLFSTTSQVYTQLQERRKIFNLNLDPLVKVDVLTDVKVRDQLDQVVGGGGGLTAVLKVTLQIPKYEKHEQDDKSETTFL